MDFKSEKQNSSYNPGVNFFYLFFGGCQFSYFPDRFVCIEYIEHFLWQSYFLRCCEKYIHSIWLVWKCSDYICHSAQECVKAVTSPAGGKVSVFICDISPCYLKIA